MNKRKLITGGIIFSMNVILLSQTVSAQKSGRIYGKIYTRDDETYEGRIRWDNHETAWEDILDANHYIYSDYAYDNRSKVTIFGLKFRKDRRKRRGRATVEMGVKFGHLKSIERLSRNSALLTYQSGRELEVFSNSTDIGENVRGIIIEDIIVGTTKLYWDDLDRVEFKREPGSYSRELTRENSNRICGKVLSWHNDEYEGAIMWDNDETLLCDILDGEDHGREYEIEFSKISAIERDGRRAAVIELIGDRTLRLSGTNDVNDENRGIYICGPDYGQVIISWRDLDRSEFLDAEKCTMRDYDDFDGGKKLYGEIITDDGESYKGNIRWDDDEEYTCDLLDGSDNDIDYEIEFANIKIIRKRSSRSAFVELKNGKKLRLSGSNDVNDDNKGIFIINDDEEVRVPWEDFKEARFE